METVRRLFVVLAWLIAGGLGVLFVIEGYHLMVGFGLILGAFVAHMTINWIFQHKPFD